VEIRIEVEQSRLGYQVRIMSDDEDDFFAALNRFKEEISRHSRRFKPDGGYWLVERRAKTDLENWLAVMRADYGAEVTRDGEPENEGHPLGEQYAILHLLPSAPPDLVKAAHRVLARLHHPDIGGNTGEMQRINAAVERIEQSLQSA
jgi:hypothetical protein